MLAASVRLSRFGNEKLKGHATTYEKTAIAHFDGGTSDAEVKNPLSFRCHDNAGDFDASHRMHEQIGTN